MIRLFKNKIPFIILCIIWIGFLLFIFSKINAAYKVNHSMNHSHASTQPSFYWMILIIGGIILLALSYVSWRKYVGQKKQKRKHRID